MIEAAIPWRSAAIYAQAGHDIDHTGDGANAHRSCGIGVPGSLSSDAQVDLEFEVPDQLPKGSPKLRLRAIADAVAGNAKLLCEWGMCTQVGGNASDPSSITLNDETGTPETLSWAVNDDDAWKTHTIALDAEAIGLDDQGKLLIVHFTFDATLWTLAADSVWLIDLIWES